MVGAVGLEDVERALNARFSTRPIVAALEPHSLEQIYQDIDRLAAAWGVDGRGIRLVDEIPGEMAQIGNRPGPRVAQSLRILAEILYPESFKATLEGNGWGKF